MSRNDKQHLIHQTGHVFWLTGLPGSGKSTLAFQLDRHLLRMGYLSKVVDGDEMRKGLCADLGFTSADRRENIRRVAELARCFLETGVVVICSLVSPEQSFRDLAKDIIGDTDFSLIFVDAGLQTCIARDPKGLYKKAINGLIPNFTGISAPFEAPEQPELKINTEELNIEASSQELLAFALTKIGG